MRPRLSEGRHLVHHAKLIFLRRRDQWGLPQDLLGGSVLVARSSEHGLPAQQAQVYQLFGEGLPRREGRTKEANEEHIHSGVRGTSWEDGAQRLQQLYGMVCSWALMAAHTKGSVFLQKPKISNEPCPKKGAIAGGTCPDHRVSNCPRDANPDLSAPVQVANLFELEKVSSSAARERTCPGFQANMDRVADVCNESP